MNEAIANLKADGTLAKLAETYLARLAPRFSSSSLTLLSAEPPVALRSPSL